MNANGHEGQEFGDAVHGVICACGRPAFDGSDHLVGTLDLSDALVHHCQTIHSSAPNTNDRSRGALPMVCGEYTVTSATLKQDYTQQAVVAG